MENTNNNTTFAMCVIGFEGAAPDARFTFTAKDQNEAEARAIRWAAYHSFSRRDVIVREARGNELNWTPKNEYVS